MIGVYGILCLPTGKMYIGQSTDVKKRWNKHKNNLKGKTHFSPRLQKAWNKYGEDMFRLVLIEPSTKSKVYKRELWWIKTLETYKSTKGYNRHWKEALEDKHRNTSKKNKKSRRTIQVDRKSKRIN